jgi:hypothetical protein
MRNYKTVKKTGASCVLALSLVLYGSCASSVSKGENPASALAASVGSKNGVVLTVDNPTPFTVYFERGQRVAGKSTGRVSLTVEDATLTGGFDILYEIPLSDTMRLFCKGDRRTIRENQSAFTVNEPRITENYGTYITITNTADNAISFYSGAEALPGWEQKGNPVAGNYITRSGRREFSRGETPVFMIEVNSRYDRYVIRDGRKNIPLALPPKVERNYVYSFEYNSVGVKLTDTRPLSRIGESGWVKTIPGALGTTPLVSGEGRFHIFASTDRGLNRYDFDSAGNGGVPLAYGSGFDITFASQSAAGFFVAGYETDGRDYRPVARIHKQDGALMSSLAPSVRRDCRSAYFLTAAPKDGASKDNATWLAAGGGGDLTGHAAYARLVREEGGALAALWELAGDDFDTKDPSVKCGPVKSAAYDSRQDRWLLTGGTIEFDSLRRPVPGSYIAAISGGGVIAYIDASFKGMSFNKITVDAAGDWYLAGEERQGNETFAVLVKFNAGGKQLWRLSGSSPSHSYYEDALLDGENNRIVLGGVMRGRTGSGAGGVPFVEAVDTADGTSLWLEPLPDSGGAALVTGICRAPDYGFALALSGITDGCYAKPFMIARVNSYGVLFRYRN